MRRKDEERAEARRLRAEGLTITEITKRLGVSRSSVSTWVRDVEISDGHLPQYNRKRRHYVDRNQAIGANANRKKAMEKRKQYQEAGRQKAREGRMLHYGGCLLYWAEGAKNRNCLNFVNSDEYMLRIYMRFLREELLVQNEDIVIHILCHSKDADEIKRVEAYWLDFLGLSSSSLRKTSYKKGSDTRHNTLHNGIVSVRVYKTELIMHVYGAIQEYGKFDNPDWLF